MRLLRKIQSAKVYELLLWLTFLVGTFFIGFFHGSSPEKQINFYYQETKKIDILVNQEGVLTTSFIKYIEKETHTHINIIIRKSFKEFRTEMIVNKNLHLLLFPEAFVEPLFNENRIKNIDPLSSIITDSVHSDFHPKKHRHQYYSVPISWFINVFSKEKKGNKAVYVDNVFLLNQKAKNHFFQFNKDYSLEKNWQLAKPLSDVFETTIQQAARYKKTFDVDLNSSFLITYSLGVPNNTPDRKLSFEILRLLILSKELKALLADNGLGQTFLSPMVEYSMSNFEAPGSMRNLNLNKFKNANQNFEEQNWNVTEPKRHN